MRMAAVAVLFALAAARSASGQTVLVLPFFNESGSGDFDWIGESISETLSEVLASQDLFVVDRDDRAVAYRRLGIRANSRLTRASVMKTGETLDADLVIYGEFQVRPDPAGAGRGTLQVAAHILSLREARQGPEFSELGALEDLTTLESHLAWQTLQYLRPNNPIGEEEFRRSRTPVRVEAVESYIRGLLAPAEEAKRTLFAQSARLDTRYSQPNFQLGRLLYRKQEYRAAADSLQRVLASFSEYRESVFLLGLCRYHTGDFAGAEKAFQQVAAVVPLNEVWNNLAAAQSRRNQLPQAIENFRRAVEGDPNDAGYRFNLGYVLWKKGDYAGANEQFRAALERAPDDEGIRMLLSRSSAKISRKAFGRDEGLERLKTEYEERAYRTLKSILAPGKAPD
ncbi:MAG: tetratricopeptide repeat protein [Bryobacteraceae bacterium]|nr:tetratricopeptide repeat protein [Bryobacteraceae bacterium]